MLDLRSTIYRRCRIISRLPDLPLALRAHVYHTLASVAKVVLTATNLENAGKRNRLYVTCVCYDFEVTPSAILVWAKC